MVQESREERKRRIVERDARIQAKLEAREGTSSPTDKNELN